MIDHIWNLYGPPFWQPTTVQILEYLPYVILLSNSGPEDKEITVSFTNSKTVAVPLDTAIWIPTEVYERLALELKMPKEAREALSTENSYPKESLEGNTIFLRAKQKVLRLYTLENF